MKWGKHRIAPGSTPAPSSLFPRPRFASDVFAWHYGLNKGAPYWHEPIANLGVTQGSGPMLFEVGSYGNAQAQLNAIYAVHRNMTPDTQAPIGVA